MQKVTASGALWITSCRKYTNNLTTRFSNAKCVSGVFHLTVCFSSLCILLAFANWSGPPEGHPCSSLTNLLAPVPRREDPESQKVVVFLQTGHPKTSKKQISANQNAEQSDSSLSQTNSSFKVSLTLSE